MLNCIASSLAPTTAPARADAPAPPDTARPRRIDGLAAGPDGGQRSAATDAMLITLGIYGAQALIFVAGIAQKGLLGPKGAGYWALMGTFMTFFGLASIGAFDGASRQMPFYRGRREYGDAARVANTAGSFTVTAMAVLGTCVAVAAIAFGGEWAPEIRWGLVILGLTAPLRSLTDCTDFILQATKRFDASALGLIVKASITLFVQTALVAVFGFYGMFMGLVIGSVVVLALWIRMGLTGPRRPAFRWGVDRRSLAEVVAVGIPITLFAQVWALFMAVDGVIVAGYIDVEHLGYYALAISTTSYIILVPKGIGAALFPRIIERYAPSGDIRSIRHYATDVQRLLTYALVSPAIMALFFLLPVLVRQALPEFTPAVPAIHVALAGCFFIALIQMPVKVLIAAGHRWALTLMMVGLLAFNAAANYTAVAVLDSGVTGAAVATATSYMAVFIALTGFLLLKAYSRRSAFLHFAEMFTVFAYLVTVLWGVELLLGDGGANAGVDIGLGVMKLGLSLLLFLPWLIRAQKRYGVFGTIWSLVRRGLTTVSSNLPRRGPQAK
jgi:O-antigen/teichoic acid export membrane protein